MKRFMSSKSTSLQSPKVRAEFSPLFGARVPNNWLVLTEKSQFSWI
jgi:hypothetical protein